MTIAICTPLSVTCKDRLRNWNVVYNHTVDLVNQLGIQWIVAESGGQHAKRSGCTRVKVKAFSRSATRNAAWLASDASHICFMDADLLMKHEDWLAAIQRSIAFDCYSPATRVTKLGPTQTTNRIVADRFDFSRAQGLAHFRGNLFGGISFCRRGFLDDVGGWDERFRGWGYEDAALEWLAKAGGYQIGWDSFPCYHLYHGRRQRTGKAQTHRLFCQAYRSQTFESALRLRGINPPQKLDPPSRQASV